MSAIVTNSLSVLGERVMNACLPRPRWPAPAERALGGREREDEDEADEEECVGEWGIVGGEGAGGL